MNKKILIIALITTLPLLFTGCKTTSSSDASANNSKPATAQKKEALNTQRLQESIARTFGVATSDVVLSNVELNHVGMGSTDIYTNASIKGKAYRCVVNRGLYGIYSSPTCAKPGQPLNRGNPLHG